MFASSQNISLLTICHRQKFVLLITFFHIIRINHKRTVNSQNPCVSNKRHEKFYGMSHYFFFATLQMNPTKVTTPVPIIPVKIPEIVAEFVLFNSDGKNSDCSICQNYAKNKGCTKVDEEPIFASLYKSLQIEKFSKLLNTLSFTRKKL